MILDGAEEVTVRDSDVAPAVLSESRHAEILASVILPRWTGGAVAQEQPVVVVVVGPPGSGKSAACRVLKAVLDRRGGAVLVGRDLYKPAHPEYRRLLGDDDRTAGVKVRPDVLRWQAEVEEYVRGHRFDAVVEDPVAGPDLHHREGFHPVEAVAASASHAVGRLLGLANRARWRAGAAPSTG
ncbi:zeta toxin family protein [Streptomyces alfalfae]|uniref:zeta toxin family protein n=1 Tax=Streptomyces alfalfae TaxID=1642299 RepID=UPI002811DB35|nr:zeta toxin family protein [Streptomyces alfalfae]